MFSMQEIAQGYPGISLFLNFATIIFYVCVIWLFGRMGDNVNKIRKMLDQEIRRNRQS
jgi:hypothetical protein